jgi:hypothetical protein
MTLYPDLDYTRASGTSTYVRYTSADKLRELQLAIHEVICKKVKGGKEKEESPENKAEIPTGGVKEKRPFETGSQTPTVKEAQGALPPSTNGPGLPATTPKYGSPANTSKYGAPATTQTYGLPATTQQYGVPATTGNSGLPYDATKYVNQDQKALPEPNKVLELPPPNTTEEKPEEPAQEEPKPEEKQKEESSNVDCCDYFIKITTNKVRMIEKGDGSTTFRFRYLMSENLLKELGSGEQVSNTDKFTISITPASNNFSKLFTSSFTMNLDEFNSTDSNYPGNLIVAIIPTLELDFTGTESLSSSSEVKTYDEVSAKILRKRILALEFDPNNQGLSDAQKEELFRKTITTWEEDTRKDVETTDPKEAERLKAELEKEADEPEIKPETKAKPSASNQAQQQTAQPQATQQTTQQNTK